MNSGRLNNLITRLSRHIGRAATNEDEAAAALEGLRDDNCYLAALLDTAVDAAETNGLQMGLSREWLEAAKKMMGKDK